MKIKSKSPKSKFIIILILFNAFLLTQHGSTLLFAVLIFQFVCYIIFSLHSSFIMALLGEALMGVGLSIMILGVHDWNIDFFYSLPMKVFFVIIGLMYPISVYFAVPLGLYYDLMKKEKIRVLFWGREIRN